MTGPLVQGSPVARAVHSIMLANKYTVIGPEPGLDPLAAACGTIGVLLAHRPSLEVAFLADSPRRRDELAADVGRLLAGAGHGHVGVLIGSDGLHPNPRPTVKVRCAADIRNRLGAALAVLDADRPTYLPSFDPVGTIRQVLVAGDDMLLTDWRDWVDGQDPAYWDPVPIEVLLAGDPAV